MTSSMTGMILKDVAAIDASIFISWIDDLTDAVKSNSNMVWSLVSVFGQIGRLDNDKSIRIMNLLFDLLSENKSNSTVVPMILQAIKSILI